jgi:hypothetical protein
MNLNGRYFIQVKNKDSNRWTTTNTIGHTTLDNAETSLEAYVNYYTNQGWKGTLRIVKIQEVREEEIR